jgi:hypothetical protein
MLLLRWLHLVFLVAATASDAATESSSTDGGENYPLESHHLLRSVEEEESANMFPRVYAAIVPGAASSYFQTLEQIDAYQSFVAQVDFLKVVERRDDGSVEIAFLVHDANELEYLQEQEYSLSSKVVKERQTVGDFVDQNRPNMHLHQNLTHELRSQLEYSSAEDEQELIYRSQRQQSSYSTIADFSCYKNVQCSFDWMQDMVIKANSIPNLSVSLTDIGDSYLKTVNSQEGYDMWAMKITGSGIANTAGISKSIVFIMAGLHAREYSPPEFVSQWAELLIDAYNIDADISAMLDVTKNSSRDSVQP